MLTNDVYSERGVAVAQISLRPGAHLPFLMLMNCVGKYKLQPYTVCVGRHVWSTHSDAGLTVKTTNNCHLYFIKDIYYIYIHVGLNSRLKKISIC